MAANENSLANVSTVSGRPLPARQPVPSILVVGDSLSAGYGIEMRDGWSRSCNKRAAQQGYPHAVVNASISATRHPADARVCRMRSNATAPQIVISRTRRQRRPARPVAARNGAQSGSHDRNRTNRPARGAAVGITCSELWSESTASSCDLSRPGARPTIPALVDPSCSKASRSPPGSCSPDGIPQPARPPASRGLLDNVWPSLEPLLKLEIVPASPRQISR